VIDQWLISNSCSRE